MAGRIRSIKPEVLSDERSAALSSDAWRLWVSMWLLADDFGRLRSGAAYLKAQVFWATSEKVKVDDLLIELETAGLILRCTVNGQQYSEITNWSKHQRIDNASKSRSIPGLDEAFAAVRGEPRRLAAVRGSDLDLDRDVEKEGKGRDSSPSAPAPAVTQVMTALNAARKRLKPSLHAIRETKPNTKHIAERLKDGHTVEECLHVVAVCEAECRRDAKSLKWFNPVSPFRSDNFARKLAEDPSARDGPSVLAEKTAERGRSLF